MAVVTGHFADWVFQFSIYDEDEERNWGEKPYISILGERHHISNIFYRHFIPVLASFHDKMFPILEIQIYFHFITMDQIHVSIIIANLIASAVHTFENIDSPLIKAINHLIKTSCITLKHIIM